VDFERPLVTGTLLRRYKRFLADVELPGLGRVTCHVPNSGAMTGMADPGLRVAVMESPGPGRKLKWTLELVEVGTTWVGVNTLRANPVVAQAIAGGRVASLRGYPDLRREVRFGQDSRVDILLTDGTRRCYVEVKNTTLRDGRRALFPDAVTDRGAKHLVELRERVRLGDRAVIFFLVNRADCTSMAPADLVDRRYGELLREVVREGVEALAYRARSSLDRVELERRLPVRL
jgi:sugar fermentation stimulation protein A